MNDKISKILDLEVLMKSLVVFICLITSLLFAGNNWPEFRGPSGNGITDATNIPTEWSENKNVKWKTKIHDRGWSSPVVYKNQIWLTTATQDGDSMWAVCVDFQSGKIVHDILLLINKEPQRIHGLNSYATPSPVIEKGSVYVHYGTFGTFCLSTQTGKTIWKRTDLNCEHMQGPATSLFLYKNLLIVHVEGTDVQYVVGLDKKTGKTLWKSERPQSLYKDVQPVYRKDYATPIIIQEDGKDLLISPGAQICMALDPLTGKEIWRVIYKHDSTVSRPVAGEGMVFLNTGWDPNGRELWAARLGGKGDITKTHVKWKCDKNAPGESSPIFVDDLLYWIEDNGKLMCVQPKTGELVWSKRLRGKFGASPIYANGLIYFMNKKGVTSVIRPGNEFEQVSENILEKGIWASPAVVGNSLIIRTETHLYCLENK